MCVHLGAQRERGWPYQMTGAARVGALSLPACLAKYTLDIWTWLTTLCKVYTPYLVEGTRGHFSVTHKDSLLALTDT
jgi:hypothetical protein